MTQQEYVSAFKQIIEVSSRDLAVIANAQFEGMIKQYKQTMADFANNLMKKIKFEEPKEEAVKVEKIKNKK